MPEREERRAEYRVKWKRKGVPAATKLYQTRAGAERWMLLIQGKMAEFTGEDPEDYGCCSGWECGCGGRTFGEIWEERAQDIPPLEVGPVLETRAVGEWGVSDA